ncbi:membrane protein [Flavobacterium suaedae]|uniref:Membrane protein n=1 Tax=Flavobacterium suaedae TaxID=1767027 RepID=A0ABQ1JFG9_9FLAO|nr:hypothetical protein [Flavobacterium suaedae]GGB65527.1 membrane protein [Flavobacterium suaedae]
MLLIFISWIYIGFVTINLGCLFAKLVKLKTNNFSVIAILGLFTTTLIASFWAIFKNVGLEFHILLLLLTLASGYSLRKEIKAIYKEILSKINSLKLICKSLLFINIILIIAQCASSPYVIDNESYYIQSIKWLNECGFVKGLGNIHFFLAQSSGWHITQSAFSFSFLYSNFNDISGYCLLLGNLFCIFKLNEYFTDRKFNSLVIGMFPLANVFFFQFISAPSPDIPVYVFSFIIFSYFLTGKKETFTEDFKIIALLIIYLIFIKTTAVALLTVPLIMFFSNFKKTLPAISSLSIIGLITLSAFIVKNTIISGYPLFPVVNFAYNADWVIPESIAQMYYDETKVYGYLLKKSAYDSMSYKELILRWLTLPKLHGLFNLIGAILIFITPFGIYKFKNERKWWILYTLMVVQMVILFISSPQYRFFMNTLLLFSFFFAALIFTSSKLFLNKMLLKPILIFSMIATAYVLFIPIDLNKFAENKFALETSNFKLEEIVAPHSNSKLNTEFEKVTIGNLTFYSPIKNDFFWASGNGPIPCVNKAQIKYFERKTGYIPQQRSNKIKDGFFAKKVDNN